MKEHKVTQGKICIPKPPVASIRDCFVQVAPLLARDHTSCVAMETRIYVRAGASLSLFRNLSISV